MRTSSLLSITINPPDAQRPRPLSSGVRAAPPRRGSIDVVWRSCEAPAPHYIDTSGEHHRCSQWLCIIRRSGNVTDSVPVHTIISYHDIFSLRRHIPDGFWSCNGYARVPRLVAHYSLYQSFVYWLDDTQRHSNSRSAPPSLFQ